MLKKYSHRMFLLLICSIMVQTGCFPMSKVSAQSYQKATWLWDTTLIKNSTADILSFSASNGVTVIYLQINRKLSVSYYKNFIKQATAEGIEVHALDGAAGWGLEAQRSQIAAFLKWVNSYQGTAAEAEKFKGIHVDIEPYQLPEWTTDQASVISQWQNNVLYLVKEAKAMNLSAAADLPFWLNNFNASSGEMTLSSWMINQYHSITLMAYRDTAADIYSVALNQLLEAAALGKPILTGVETNPSAEAGFVTFYEEGASIMNTELLNLSGLAQARTSFAGVAVHDYAGWRSLISQSAL